METLELLDSNLGQGGGMADDDEEQQEAEINWPVLIVFLLVVVLGGGFGVRAWLRGRAEDHFRRCQTNLQVIATSARMYAKDHKGQFPKSLDEMVQQKYLPEIPNCPAVGSNTYTDYQVSTKPRALTVSCVGGHHVDFYRSVGDPQKFPSVSLP